MHTDQIVNNKLGSLPQAISLSPQSRQEMWLEKANPFDSSSPDHIYGGNITLKIIKEENINSNNNNISLAIHL